MMSAAATSDERARVVVTQRAAARVKSRHPWVYRSDLVSAESAAPGSLVAVADERGRMLGTALYSSTSQIALRMVGSIDLRPADVPQLVRERIRAAVEYRRHIVHRTDAYRVVFSEADFLPGLVVDRYNDVLSVQVLTQAMDRPELREAFVDELVQQFSPASIVERMDDRIRELEQLAPRETGLLYGTKTRTTFQMNGLAFTFDATAGQKTGAFLDQRENYAAAAHYAHGDALDVFCYQGGFALHLARACRSVSGVDASRAALETAEQNVALNKDVLGSREIEWVEANAFELLRDYADTDRRYDTIVLDPPAFAKSRRALDTALRGYKELNLRALKMLRPGGILVTCSCSFHVSQYDFMQMVADAALDAHRDVRVIEARGQAKDHPVLISVPETFYLKCVIASVR